MSLHRVLCVAAVALIGGMSSTASACCWLFGCGQGYTAGYSPYYAGYGPTAGYYGSGYGYSSTSFYNPFAAMWPGYYGSYGYGYNAYSSGCSTCGDSGCSTGNCGITTGKPAEPTPDNPPRTNTDDPMPTYDPMETNPRKPPVDDPNFRETQPGSNDAFPNVEGETGAFKIPDTSDSTSAQPTLENGPNINPMKGTETLKDKENSETLEAPTPEVNFAPTLIDPRNSARVVPTLNLDQKVTWRSAPVIVRQTERVPTSQPLIVRKAVRVSPQMLAPQALPVVRK